MPIQFESLTIFSQKDMGRYIRYILFSPVSVALREALAAICPEGHRFSCVEFNGRQMAVKWKGMT